MTKKKKTPKPVGYAVTDDDTDIIYSIQETGELLSLDEAKQLADELLMDSKTGIEIVEIFALPRFVVTGGKAIFTEIT